MSRSLCLNERLAHRATRLAPLRCGALVVQPINKPNTMTIASIIPINADSTTTDAITVILRRFGHEVVNTGHSLKVNAYSGAAPDVVAFKETRGDILYSNWKDIGVLLPTDNYLLRFTK